MFRITSEICGNMGISEFPVNWEKTAVTCIDVLWMSLSGKKRNGWISLRCCTFLFLSNVLFDFVVFFVVVFLTAPGNNHLKALAIREWPSLTNPLLKLCLCSANEAPYPRPLYGCPTLYGPMPWTSTYQGSNNRFFPSSSLILSSSYFQCLMHTVSHFSSIFLGATLNTLQFPSFRPSSYFVVLFTINE